MSPVTSKPATPGRIETSHSPYGAEMSIFVPKSSTATRYKEVFGAKMRTYEIQVAGSISTQGGRIGVTADNQHPVLTSSFNFTKTADEHNAENLLVIQNAPLPAKYAKNWQEHLEHSELYPGR